MSLMRQGSLFVAVGVLQYLVDWGVLVLLSHFGLNVEIANVAGRVCGAMLGFLLNGRITFAGHDTTVGHRQLRRFVVLWLGTTLVSTVAIGAIENRAGLQWAWMAKPAIELALAAVGFVVSRRWVYRR